MRKGRKCGSKWGRYSPSHRPAGDQMINIQSTLRTAPDLFKKYSLAVLIGNNGNSCTVSIQSDMFIYKHILQNVEALIGKNK